MSLFIAALNSGSNGNCYYIGNEDEAIFVDAGLACSEIERRMQRLGLPMQKVKAIFISHEHKDHIFGVPTLAKKYKLPVYITETTYKHGGMRIAENQVLPFNPGNAIQIGKLLITAFTKSHDAVDPHSFIVSGNEVTVGIFTDIGKPCKQLIHHFQLCHAAFLEANYDEDLLYRSSYPYFLKQRIQGDEGHLSNRQALDLFNQYRPPFMSHLILSHLSKENNSPAIVENLFTEHAGTIKVIVASRVVETSVYQISHQPIANRTLLKKLPVRPQPTVQLGLFD
jgi:phosphoribosyl 1,2-cyclic phosphodiesterase